MIFMSYIYRHNIPINDIYQVGHKISYNQIYCTLLRISGLITTLTTHGKHRLRGASEPGFSIIEAKINT